jgi:hypothetical protein
MLWYVMLWYVMLVLSCLVLSCLILSDLVVSCLFWYCLIFSSLLPLSHRLLLHSFTTPLSHLISSHLISSHLISSHLISSHLTSSGGVLFYNSITGDMTRSDPHHTLKAAPTVSATKEHFPFTPRTGPFTPRTGTAPTASPAVPGLLLAQLSSQKESSRFSEVSSRFAEDDGPSAAGGMMNKATRRQWLKVNGKAEWDAAASGPVVRFYDNVNRLQFNDIPAVLDRLGELTTLTKLTLTKNKVYLPLIPRTPKPRTENP